MFPAEILERIFAFIETGSFLTETTNNVALPCGD